MFLTPAAVESVGNYGDKVLYLISEAGGQKDMEGKESSAGRGPFLAIQGTWDFFKAALTG